MRGKSLATLVLLLGAFPLAGHQEQPGKPEAEAELLMRRVANLGSSRSPSILLSKLPSSDRALRGAL